MKPWTNINTIYQIYPRSYQDASGDGVGDLNGIIQRLPYLKGEADSLGVDAIWLSPVYASPMRDCGYDVSDFRAIDPVFGSMDDFRRLLAEAHYRGLRVMMDFVPNHTSDQHEWFREARQSRDSNKRDYYIWRDGKPDGSLPNNWSSLAGGSMWHYDEGSGQYYLHSFMQEQPDLNWANPRVREEMQHVMRYWFDMGVDGFRVDAIWKLAKDPDFADNPFNEGYGGSPYDYGATIHVHSKNGPNLDMYLKAMTDVAAEYKDKQLLFEFYSEEQPLFGTIFEQYKKLYAINPTVASPLCMNLMGKPWNASEFKTFLREFQNTLRTDDRPAYCISNHDQMRIVSRWGREQARVTAMLLMTLPGLPTMYYGDEIGMENVDISKEYMNDLFDVQAGMGGRDPERTPMQWDSTKRAGFTTGQPWLPIPSLATVHNVANQQNDPDSILALYKALLALRSKSAVWIKGEITFIESVDTVIAYGRRYGTDRYIVLLNFSEQPQTLFASYVGTVILATHPSDMPELQKNGEITLKGLEGVIIKV